MSVAGDEDLDAPASPATRAAAHAALDPLWANRLWTPEGWVLNATDQTLLLARSRAYQLLAEELGLPETEVHLSLATERVARLIPAAVERIRDRLAHRSRMEIARDFRERGREIHATRRGDNPWHRE